MYKGDKLLTVQRALLKACQTFLVKVLDCLNFPSSKFIIFTKWAHYNTFDCSIRVFAH